MKALAPTAVPDNRKIIHIDMDAFFASVEQRDAPHLQGKPVVVGGDPQGRGVVAACSYEARAFGIHSAMSCAKARQLCPQAVFVQPKKEKYQEVSRQIMSIFHQYTDLVEPLSVDEAFLDITVNHKNIPSATWVAEAIRREIVETTRLTASAGVSCNKFIAKVASDQNKPDGLTVITPEQALPFISRLPVRKFHGVGRVTEKKMHGLGIYRGADLQRFSQEALVHHFGKGGVFLYNIVRGRDSRPVQPHRVRKSIGSETTLKEDILKLTTVQQILDHLTDKIASLLAQKKNGGKTLCLKVRYDDFTTITRSSTSARGFFTADDISSQLPLLLAATEAGQRKIRLLGLTISNLFIFNNTERPQLYFRQLPLPFPPLTTGATGTHNKINKP